MVSKTFFDTNILLDIIQNRTPNVLTVLEVVSYFRSSQNKMFISTLGDDIGLFGALALIKINKLNYLNLKSK